MAVVKLKHPSGKTQTFEFGHAQRILKKQADKGYPKKSCWVMVEKNPKKDKANDSNNPADNSDSTKEKGGGTSGG